MVLAAAAVERAMKIQQVVMRALSGAITWLQAAEILGLHPRSVQRWRARFERGGTVALYDRRCLRPSRRQAPAGDVQRILRLYRERFRGWNVRHFYRFARRDHGVTLSYSFVKLALQEAGLVRKGRSPRSAAPSSASASSISGRTRRRPAAAASGSIAPCRDGSSTSSPSRGSPRWPKPSGRFTCQQQATLRAARQGAIVLCAGRPDGLCADILCHEEGDETTAACRV